MCGNPEIIYFEREIEVGKNETMKVKLSKVEIGTCNDCKLSKEEKCYTPENESLTNPVMLRIDDIFEIPIERLDLVFNAFDEIKRSVWRIKNNEPVQKIMSCGNCGKTNVKFDYAQIRKNIDGDMCWKSHYICIDCRHIFVIWHNTISTIEEIIRVFGKNP